MPSDASLDRRTSRFTHPRQCIKGEKMNHDQDQSRRDFLASAAMSVGALALAAPGAAAVAADPKDAANVATAFQTNETLKPLPFDPAKVPGLSEKMLRSHWENNYGGSVKALAAVKKRLAAALGDKDLPPYIYNDLKREHLIRTGSVVLHEVYFANLGGSGKAGASERQLIASAFGTYDAWESEFRRIGAGLGGGSGWVVLGYNQHTHLLENYWMADHASAPADTTPLLVMDMYEHSYQMDYGAAAAKYIDAFFQNIQWDAVAARMTGLPQAKI
jgi:Fe-Mn family superoxide dismutase